MRFLRATGPSRGYFEPKFLLRQRSRPQRIIFEQNSVTSAGNGSLPITYHSSRVPSSILTRFAVYRTSLSFLRAGFNLASRSRSSISALRSIDLFLTLTDACGDSFFTGRIGRPIVVDDFSGNNLGGITL